jgi:hypothetical protein
VGWCVRGAERKACARDGAVPPVDLVRRQRLQPGHAEDDIIICVWENQKIHFLCQLANAQTHVPHPPRELFTRPICEFKQHRVAMVDFQ